MLPTETLVSALVIVAGLQYRRGCLWAHHGTLAAHDSLTGALNVAEVIEEIAKLYVFTLGAGEPFVLSTEEVATVIEKHKTYGQQPATI